MIIGVTGKYCSGKDTVANLLKQKGFVHISLSDLIREEAKKQALPDTRENLINLGNELRRLQGNGVLAQWAIRAMDVRKHYVVTSVRNPAEVAILRSQPHFLFINVAASAQTRWKRMQARQRNDSLKTFEDFQQRETQESTSTDPTHQQLNAVIALADLTIDNNNTLQQLQHRIEQLILPKITLP